MPTQWPLFINNVSSKLASRSSKGADDFGTFMANEYFNAVKTSQTPFGNLHSPGQKTILEIGFKKAFNDLFKSATPSLEDKIKDSNYADLLEGLPVPKKYDAAAEFRKWTISKGDKLPDTNFYEFFPPKPDAVTPELTNAEVFGSAVEQTQPILTFTGKGGLAPYTFTYTINDGEPIQIISDEYGFSTLYVPFDAPVKLKYTLTNVVDSAFPDIQHKLNQVVKINIPKDATKPTEVLNGTKKVKLVLTEDEKLELIVKRVLYQNDGNIKFVRFLTRLSLGYENAYGKKVADECIRLLGVSNRKTIVSQITEKYTNLYNNRLLVPAPGLITSYVGTKYAEYQFTIGGVVYSQKTSLVTFLAKNDTKIQSEADAEYERVNSNLKTTLKNPLDKKLIQLEYLDDKEVWPTWLTDFFICKFCYVKNIDDISLTSHNKADSVNENERIEAKRKLYKLDRDKYNALQKQWIDELAVSEKKDGDPADGKEDPYDVMANAIIAYWMSCAVAPFKPGPPIPPCNIPSPGTYIPLYYGSRKSLAKNLRRAWNTGKLAKAEPLLQPATKAVAAAVAAACAKHLLELKFIYVGQLTVGVATIPMIGFVPTTF
jgi:hypothetical protein